MTDGMLAREALERKECRVFLVEEIGRLLASSPEFRVRCLEMLRSGRGCLDFEDGLRGGLLDGAGHVWAGWPACR